MKPPNFQEHHKNSLNNDKFMKILSWAYLNFQVQKDIEKDGLSEFTHAQLIALGFNEKVPTNAKNLFQNNGFCSPEKTSQRIASYTLKEVGLNASMFEEAQEGIRSAYEDVKHNSSPTLKQSLERTLDTLAVFKP